MSVRIIFRALRALPPENETQIETENAFIHTNFTIQGSDNQISSDEALDTNLSVYSVEPPELIQALTEHYASLNAGPIRREIVIIKELPPSSELVKTPGKTKFSFTNDRHYELRLKNKVEVRNFAKSLLKDIASIRMSFSPLVQFKHAAHFIHISNVDWKKLYESGLLHDRWHRPIEKELSKIAT